ncbi:hypothetical protein [Thauera sp. WH-1]|uniref:hypothetical protein n=1 Tax=Thauera sp. WH-1 TaxID=3398230 RepID=UPI0039FC1185
MREWPALPPDDELTRADDLLNQADALLRRHHQSDQPAPASTDDWAPGTELDDDDLPILTEVVDDFELPHPLPPTAVRAPTGFERPPAPEATAAAALAAASTPSPAALHDALSAKLAERLVELDTEIAREIGNWVAMEMPQILARELDQLASRVQAEMQAHLRATLLPALSARVGSLLDHKATPHEEPDRPSDD